LQVAFDNGSYAELQAGAGELIVTRTGTCAAMSLEEARAEREEGWVGEEGIVGGEGTRVPFDQFVGGLQRFPPVR
jgi:hypothetical protein